MGVLSTIGKLAGMVVGGIPGAIIGAGATLLDSDSKESSDGKPRLVARPTPPSGKEERKGFASWANDNSVSDPNSRSGSTARAVSATKGVSPSQMEANYWSAIFADAKRKSEVG